MIESILVAACDRLALADSPADRREILAAVAQAAASSAVADLIARAGDLVSAALYDTRVAALARAVRAREFLGVQPLARVADHAQAGQQEAVR